MIDGTVDSRQINAGSRNSTTHERFTSADFFVHLLLIGLGLLITLPILIALLTSFKIPSQVVTFPPTLWPQQWTFENVQSGLITLGQVIFSILAAYAFSILVFPGRNMLFYVVLGSLMVPFELTFIPNFIRVSEWGMADAYSGLIIPFVASAFGVFMLRQFFMTIPKDLHDASKIDGSGNWRFLWSIVVPLSKGSIGAFAIFAFLSAWNQYLWPLIITNTFEMRTLQIGIRFFMSNLERGAEWGAVMAGSMIALAPALLAFLVAIRRKSANTIFCLQRKHWYALFA